MNEIAFRQHATTGTARYTLRCLSSGDDLADSTDPGRPAFPLSAPGSSNAFLRTEYEARRLRIGPASEGLYRFSDWLPVTTRLDGSGSPVSWRSEGLGPFLGLSNLFVTFSGWSPERGARIPSGTFKENEAFAVYGRMGDAVRSQTLVVASAGNTARAFLRVASRNDLPLVVVVPEENVPGLWTVGPRGDSTVVVAAGDGSDYSDAIRLAGLLATRPGYLAEGGAKNVARRDGMGTTFLSAAECIGRIPDHYFQAVGSGTGAIAAWEANLRLKGDGRFGTHLARLHLSQNAPFQVLVDSWNARSREIILPDPDTARDQISRIDAKVLANRHPPWSPTGGLYDALDDTDGVMYAVSNEDARTAGALFRRLEGIDPSPAARVAVASLMQAVESGAVGRNDSISLNITGGGFGRARSELDTHPLTPDIIAGRALFDAEAIAEEVERVMFGRKRRARHIRSM